MAANCSGYWGKQGPELLDHRLALYSAQHRMVVDLWPVIAGDHGGDRWFGDLAEPRWHASGRWGPPPTR